ncbi:hypothetical protein [Intestinibacter sp.]|uniref:hypothetical protein n=1 Tax=Intestinibacter sp. TaxID=1965304 RepID=UPI002A75BBF6|nr:hypothetical protein [Intestinibacter sp.]MDY2735192.1 hypothetical protein [Intestinibacter sp.]
MDININLKADEKLIDAIVKIADAMELVAKRGIGKALYESELIQTIADEVTNKVTKEEAPVVQATPIQQFAPATPAPANAVGQQVMPQMDAQQPVQQTFTPVEPVAPAPTPVPTTQVSYDINQLAVAATGLMDAGKQQDLMNLLAKFGVQALTQLPKEQYGAFATELRALGANI